MFDKKLVVQPVVSRPIKPDRYWMRFIREHFVKPASSLPPRGMVLPDRSWQRQSALIVSMQEAKKDG